MEREVDGPQKTLAQNTSHTQTTLALPANSHLLLLFSKAATEQYFWLGKAFNAGCGKWKARHSPHSFEWEGIGWEE